MSALSELYKRVVEDKLGLVARIDEDDDVLFCHPDFGTIFLSIDAGKDPEFLRMVYPNFADRERLGMEKERILEMVNEANHRYKAVKFFVTHLDGDCDVSASIEAFVAGADSMPDEALLRAVLRRNLSALTSGARKLFALAEEGATERTAR